ncbi:MAG TPA: hypothetical protein VFH06_01990 [Candidatus Saccharimonadales bacterium]|nr:hypothetical protein [Candidatus Saccharimonadales bacterium]
MSEPQEFVLKAPTPLSEMSVKELLQLAIEGKGDTSKVLNFLKAHEDVRAAQYKTEGTNEIIVPNADGSVNVDETVKYITNLASKFGRTIRKVAGQYPITIDEAFNLTRMVMIDPVALEFVYVGDPDKYGLGLVLSELDEGILKALNWALITGHEAMPRDLDKFAQEEFFEQLFNDRLPARVRRIIDDHKRAVTKGDLVAQGVVCRMSEEQATQMLGQFGGGGVTMSGGSAGRSSAVDYEALVREHAALYRSDITITSYNREVKGKICSQLNIHSYNTIVRNTVVLDSCRVTSYSNVVDIIMPPGKDVDDSSYSNSVNVTNMTWEQIARHLGLV